MSKHTRKVALATLIALALPMVAGAQEVHQGTNAGEKLVGGPGKDTFYARGGDDRLWGGRGPDYFNCGAGYDIVHNLRDENHDDQFANNCERIITDGEDE